MFMAKQPEKKYTRFEYARMIGARALQISAGAPPLVKSKEQDPIRIAMKEHEKGRLPLEVKRKMPPRRKKMRRVLMKKF